MFSTKLFLWCAVAVACIGIATVHGFANDIVLPHHRPLSCECDAWINGENQTSITALWGNPANLVAAGSSCAMVSITLTLPPPASFFVVPTR